MFCGCVQEVRSMAAGLGEAGVWACGRCRVWAVRGAARWVGWKQVPVCMG